MNQSEFTELKRLVEMWKMLAESTREWANKAPTDERYTIGYGYGTADAYQEAAKLLYGVIVSLSRDS
jgi:hypothetical protein